MADKPEVSVGTRSDDQHPIFDDGFQVVDHPDLSALIGNVPEAPSYGRYMHFLTDVTIFCESGVLFVTNTAGNGVRLECGDSLWIPANWKFACWSDEHSPARVATYAFGPSDLLMPVLENDYKQSETIFTPASELANTNFHGCLVASATVPLRKDPFFSNQQLVLFDSDEVRDSITLGPLRLKVGILFWGKTADGTPEKAMIHRHGPHQPVTELIRIVCGNMEAWHERTWTKRSLITITGWVWHSWRWMTGQETPLADEWQRRFPGACDNKFAVMFFIYAEGGKESKGDTKNAPSE